MDISVVIPAYNEQERIAKTLMEVFSYFKDKNFDFEIIVVNDGSLDKTHEVVESLKIENLILIKNKKNRGKGYVVRQGLLLARGRYRLFIDADNSTPIKELEKFFPYLGEYSIIIGSRAVSGSEILVAQSFFRKFLGNFYNFLVKLMTGLWDFNDTQCGFKLFSVQAVNEILPICKINGWSFDVEILILAKKMGYKIKEIPVTWRNHKNSKVKFAGMAHSVFDLVRIGWFWQFFKFAIVGFGGTLINFIILYLLTDVFGIYYMLSAVFAFLVAMTSNFFFNKIWSFEDKSPGLTQKYLKFFTVSVFALIANLFILYFLTDILRIYYLVSQIFAIIPSIFINFMGNKFWTFRETGSPSS